MLDGDDDGDNDDDDDNDNDDDYNESDKSLQQGDFDENQSYTDQIDLYNKYS